MCHFASNQGQSFTAINDGKLAALQRTLSMGAASLLTYLNSLASYPNCPLVRSTVSREASHFGCDERTIQRRRAELRAANLIESDDGSAALWITEAGWLDSRRGTGDTAVTRRKAEEMGHWIAGLKRTPFVVKHAEILKTLWKQVGELVSLAFTRGLNTALVEFRRARKQASIRRLKEIDTSKKAHRRLIAQSKGQKCSLQKGQGPQSVIFTAAPRQTGGRLQALGRQNIAHIRSIVGV